MNNKAKGNRIERAIAKLLNDRFSDITANHGSFGRSVSSGGRWYGHQQMSQQAATITSGDLVTPDNFLFTIEIKGGYKPVDLARLLISGSRQLDQWLSQASLDATRAAKEPMLIWQATRAGNVAAIQQHHSQFNHTFYSGWHFYSLENLLTLEDKYFITADK